MSLAAVVWNDVRSHNLEALKLMHQNMKWRHGGAWETATADGIEVACAGSSYIHVSPDWVVALDGRIDNLPSLRRELDVAAGPPVGVLVAAFARWGRMAPSRLLGDFAGVGFDRRRRVAWVYRDHLGVRPLFLVVAKGALLLGSTPDAIFASGLVSPVLNRTRVAGLLADLLEPHSASVFERIDRLPPASVAEWDGRNLRVSSYWSPPRHTSPRTAEDTSLLLRDALEVAVRDRVAGVERVGSQLSGGLDSSAITCLAARNHPSVETLSMRFRGDLGSLDEGSHIDVVRNGLAGPHHQIDGASMTTLASFAEVSTTWPEPAAAPNHQFNLAMFRYAADQGIDRCLTGFDGDTAVSHGERLFTDLAKDREWAALTLEADLYGQRIGRSASAIARETGPPLVVDAICRLHPKLALERFKWLVQGLGIVDALKAVSDGGRARARSHMASKVLADFGPVRPEALRGIAPALLDRAQRAVLPAGEAETHAAAISGTLLTFALELLDHHAHLAGVEAAHPMLDVRILELMVATDPRSKLRDGWTRRPLRDAIVDVVPDGVRWRSDKANFEPVFLRNLLSRDAELVRLLVADELWRLGDIVDPDGVRDLLQRTIEQTIVVRRDAYALWRVSAALAWMERRNLSVG